MTLVAGSFFSLNFVLFENLKVTLAAVVVVSNVVVVVVERRQQPSLRDVSCSYDP